MVLEPKYEDASYFMNVNPIAEIFKELNIASKIKMAFTAHSGRMFFFKMTSLNASLPLVFGIFLPPSSVYLS